MKYFILFFIALLLAVNSSFSNEWLHHENPNGMMITSILVYDENLIFATTDIWIQTVNQKSGIIKSTDGGTTWEKINHEVIANSNVSSIYKLQDGSIWTIVEDKYIYKSTDLGITWEKSPFTFIYITDITEAENGNIILSGSWPISDFAVSTDKGLSWKIEEHKMIWDITKSPDGSIYMLPEEGGIFKSTDNGITFANNAIVPISDESGRVILADKDNNIWLGAWENVYFSSDGGETWEERMNGLENILGSPICSSLAQNPVTGEIIMGLSMGVIQRYNNDANLWENYSTKLLTQTARQLVFAPSGRLFIGDQSLGVLISTDKDATLQFPDNKVGKKLVRKIFCYEDKVLIGNSDGTIYRYSGNTIENTPLKYPFLYSVGINELFVTSSGTILICRTNDGFSRSTDNGLTWSKNTTGINPNASSFLEIGNSIYAGVNSGNNLGLFMSNDDGKTWIKDPQGIDNLGIRDLKVNSKNEVIIGTNAGVYKKMPDSGEWIKTSFPELDVLQIALNENDDIFINFLDFESSSLYKYSANIDTVIQIEIDKLIQNITMINNPSSELNDALIIGLDTTWAIIYHTKSNENAVEFNYGTFGTYISSAAYSPVLNKFFAGTSNGLYELSLSLVSVNENIKGLGSQIFPNPAHDYIQIQSSEVFKTSEDYKVQIFNSLGIEVISITLSATAALQEGNFRIDISGLQPGVYFLKIGGRVQKFVKM